MKKKEKVKGGMQAGRPAGAGKFTPSATTSVCYLKRTVCSRLVMQQRQKYLVFVIVIGTGAFLHVYMDYLMALLLAPL